MRGKGKKSILFVFFSLVEKFLKNITKCSKNVAKIQVNFLVGLCGHITIDENWRRPIYGRVINPRYCYYLGDPLAR